jgi:hypothetical protein
MGASHSVRPRSTSTAESGLRRAPSGLGLPVTIAGVDADGALSAPALLVPLPLRRVRAALPARPVAAGGNPSAALGVLHFVSP